MSCEPSFISRADLTAVEWTQAPCALLVVDQSFCLVKANPFFFALIGVAEHETLGERITHRLTTASRLYFESVLAPLLLMQGRCDEVALTVQGKDRSVPVLANITSRVDRGTRLFDIALFPASARRSFEEQLLALRLDSEERASWVAQLETLSGVGAWTYQVRTGRMLWSDRVYELYGMERGVEVTLEMAIAPFSAAIRQGIRSIADKPELCTEPLVQEVEFRHASGQKRRFQIAGRYSLSHDGEPVIQGIIQDVTEVYNRQVDLWNAAHIDQMTGLGNRYLFNAELASKTGSTKPADIFDLLVLDLDGFKTVNDTFGHHAGDEVLRVIGARIGKLDASMAFRLGGDEFAMILERRDRADFADWFAQQLLIEVCQPIDIGGQDVTVRGSIGISTYPVDGEGSDAILRAADCAMYAAKNAGKNRYSRFQASEEELA